MDADARAALQSGDSCGRATAPHPMAQLREPQALGRTRIFPHRAIRRPADAQAARAGPLLGLCIPVVRGPSGGSDPFTDARPGGRWLPGLSAAAGGAAIPPVGRSAKSARSTGNAAPLIRLDTARGLTGGSAGSSVGR